VQRPCALPAWTGPQYLQPPSRRRVCTHLYLCPTLLPCYGVRHHGGHSHRERYCTAENVYGLVHTACKRNHMSLPLTCLQRHTCRANQNVPRCCDSGIDARLSTHIGHDSLPPQSANDQETKTLLRCTSSANEVWGMPPQQRRLFNQLRPVQEGVRHTERQPALPRWLLCALVLLKQHNPRK
jgi:hypothetical protein